MDHHSHQERFKNIQRKWSVGTDELSIWACKLLWRLLGNHFGVSLVSNLWSDQVNLSGSRLHQLQLQFSGSVQWSFAQVNWSVCSVWESNFSEMFKVSVSQIKQWLGLMTKRDVSSYPSNVCACHTLNNVTALSVTSYEISMNKLVVKNW